MKLHELVARFAAAAESAAPMNAVRGILENLRAELAALERGLAFIPGVGGNARQLFYRSPQVSLLKVSFPAGRRTPPHDHGAWAAILLLSGEEMNTLYLRDGGTLRRAGEKLLLPGSILTMRADTIHVAESRGGAPAVGLHAYGGDLLELPRRMWNPQTLEEHPLDAERYELFAQAASAADAAPFP